MQAIKTILLKIFSNKPIAILAFIFIAIEAIPTIGTNPNPVIFAKVTFWIFAIIFVWLKRDWAAIYLACLAIAYFVIDIILPLPQLVPKLLSLSPQLTGYNKYIPHLIVLSMTIEIIFLLCFIYYGFIIVQKKCKARNKAR
jgi:hypothetical protein